jgi:hypothetical protein
VNDELLLTRASHSVRWEDEDKGTIDVEQLREEFRRLYAHGNAAPAARARDTIANYRRLKVSPP